MLLKSSIVYGSPHGDEESEPAGFLKYHAIADACYKPIYPTDNDGTEINFALRLGETRWECYFSTSIRYNDSTLANGLSSTFREGV